MIELFRVPVIIVSIGVGLFFVLLGTSKVIFRSKEQKHQKPDIDKDVATGLEKRLNDIQNRSYVPNNFFVREETKKTTTKRPSVRCKQK